MFNVKTSVHEEVFWWTRLSVAFRTAFGCVLAGLVLQLGNMHVQWATFPIFAYVMAVTVVGESTFGKALQDTTGILVGTIQGIGMAMLVLQVVGAQRVTLSVAIICISLSSFVIVYPKRTRIISKRVALAHSAILYVTASIKRAQMDVVLFPLELAGTTMVGAISGMLALLLPFPHLAIFQVQSQVKLSIRIISERLRILVDGFCADDVIKGLSFNLQARSLAKIGSTVDAEIISKESDLGWEFPGFSEHLKRLVRGLKNLKEDLAGMEFALTSGLSSSSSRLLHCMLKDCLIHLTDWACLALRHAENGQKSSCHLQLVVDEGREALAGFSEKLSTARQKLAYLIHQEIEGGLHEAGESDCRSDDALYDSKKSFQFSSEALFFLFNLERFIEETEEILLITNGVRLEHAGKVERSKYVQLCDAQSHLPHVLLDQGSLQLKTDNSKPCKFCDISSSLSYGEVEQKKSRSWWYGVKHSVKSKFHSPHLQTAIKMSLAMGMGAFLGSWFNRSKGYWADITLALGFSGTAKGGSFKVATLRAQGTVAGSIYGLLVVLATKNFPILRLVALIPWVILTSFLRQSKIYGYAGAVSAFTGAVVILARTSKDSSDEAFTVIRIVEAFMGMASFIVVEMLVMPRRAALLVKTDSISGLGKLKSFTAAALSVFSELRCDKCCKVAVLDLKAREKSLRRLLTRLKELVKEATEEPQFWFSAFPTNVYSKLMETQSRMVDLLHFSVCAFEAVLKVFSSADVDTHELHSAFGASVRVLEENVLPLLEFLEQALEANNFNSMKVKNPPCKPNSRDKKPSDDDGKRSVELENLMNKGSMAHFLGISGRSLLHMGSIKPNCFIEEFEKSYYGFNHCSDALKEQHMEKFSNSLLLSLGSLAFSLEGLLREAFELEKGVHELLQLESPWNRIDLWDSTCSPVSCKVGL
eukprot:c17743_g1_i1 orf=321-3110(+)